MAESAPGVPETLSDPETTLLYAGEQYDPTLEQYYLRARYYNPSNGRFNRMDPFAGNNHDPQSLHKYAYAHRVPVNGVDPSGETLLLLDVLIGLPFVLGSRGQWEGARAPVYGSAIAGAKATVQVVTGIFGGYVLALAALSASPVAEALRQAKREYRKRYNKRDLPKMVLIPRSLMPKVARHIAHHQFWRPDHIVLTRAGILKKIRNRRNALVGRGRAGTSPTSGVRMSWDEYPFASTLEGGQNGVTVVKVPLAENWKQGGWIAACYFLEDIRPYDEFQVIVVP